jgi:multidrug resistance efflux pump
VDQSRQSLSAAEAAVRAARAQEKSALLAWKSEIDGENTQVAELQASLDAARLNLDWATVRAPANGAVVGLFLRPGQRVANFPVRSWMAFQDRSRTRIAVALPQYVLRHVRPGQAAEVILKLRPGATFAARVDSIAPVNSEGQIQASGVLPEIDVGSPESLQFVVILKIEDDRISPEALPGGSVGMAAIYTGQAQVTHVIRRVMIRMQSWMNYVLP